MTIDTLTPSYVPRRGPVRVTGSITNRDDAPWLDVNAFAFVSADPLRSSGELAEASLTDEAGEVGERITAPGTYDTIDRIAPGESAQFSIEVPSALLAADEPGVYWFGVHALGEGPDGREDGADGRARTFLPMVEPGRRRVDTALVVPLRHGLPHTPDGRLRDTPGWAHVLSPEGTLGRPARPGYRGRLPSAHLAGRPRPARRGRGRWPPATRPARSPPPGTAAPPTRARPPRRAPSPARRPTTAPPTPAPDADAHHAGRGRLAGAPRGGAARGAGADPAVRRRGRRRGRAQQPVALPAGAASAAGTACAQYAGTAGQAVAPPAGYLDRDGLRLAGRGDTVLVSDRMLPPDSPTLVRTAGRRVVATSSGAASGGPGPDDPFSPLAVRQRILAEAAVRLLRPGPQQLATLLPQHWTPDRHHRLLRGPRRRLAAPDHGGRPRRRARRPGPARTR